MINYMSLFQTQNKKMQTLRGSGSLTRRRQPAHERLVVATSLIGATITDHRLLLADTVGRRPMLIVSSMLYFAGGLIMLWFPNIMVLLLARLVVGAERGLYKNGVTIYS
jgi:predicted MFS family arabinose efflux permease